MSEAPARGYSWPPFEPGNTAGVRHGANSPRILEPIAERLRAELAASSAWTSARSFSPTVIAWSWAEAQCILLRDWIDSVGMLDEETGQPIPALGALDRAESRADRLRSQLGLSPAAWVQIRRSWVEDPGGAAGGLAALIATGHQMIEAAATAGSAELAEPASDSLFDDEETTR